MSGIVEMCEYAILLFESIWLLREALYVVRVPIEGIGAREVSNLGDAKLAVAHLLVQEAWLHVMRVDVHTARDNVVVHT